MDLPKDTDGREPTAEELMTLHLCGSIAKATQSQSVILALDDSEEVHITVMTVPDYGRVMAIAQSLRECADKLEAQAGTIEAKVASMKGGLH